MNVDFKKYSDGLVPAIVQDFSTHKVLMLGFMNKEALKKTETSGKVTFYSRSKKRLWTKGEESGNFLELKSIAVDCDNDTLLIKAHPTGPVCHTGADTCWSEKITMKIFCIISKTLFNCDEKFRPMKVMLQNCLQKALIKSRRKLVKKQWSL
jgi:phosphoribosyl-ATP pyrophosphohydrolase/phosphoribosyl-AMP cyclohydrolase